MGKRACLVLCLFLFFGSGALAAPGPLEAWKSGNLQVTFSGTGRESGAVLGMAINNSSPVRQALQFPRLLILEPEDTRYAPVIVEKGGAWEIGPRARFDYQVQGYSLEHSKEMPADQVGVRYRPSLGGNRYAKAQQALKKALEYEQEVGFHAAVLPPKAHRLLVIQRVLYIAQGGENPATPGELVDDLRRSFESAGKRPTKRAVEGIAASVWSDVRKVYQALTES